MALSEQEAAARYEEATAAYGAALERLGRAYEPDPELRRDLIQEIHIALWRSLAAFDGRCSLRTWVYRVAHNTATSQVFRRRPRTPAFFSPASKTLAQTNSGTSLTAGAPKFASLDELAMMPAHDYGAADGLDDEADRQRALGRLFTLIQTLAPLDRQVILLYLEDLDAAAIGEVTGLSPGNVATKVHRIKKVLSQRFHEGAGHADEPLVRGLRALWQTQPAEGAAMSIEEVRDRSRKLEEEARRRLTLMYAAAAGNAGVPLILMWFLPALRPALAWLVVTAIFLTLFVRRRSVLRTLAPALTPAEGLTFYRRLLEHERDYRRDASRWFTIGPALNILVLGFVYAASPLFHGTGREIAIMATIFATHVVVLTFIARGLRSQAHKFQLELDELAA